MRKQLRILALILAIPPMWVALATPRECPTCLPFKLVASEISIDYVELLLANPLGSLARPPSLVELMLGDMVVGFAMLGPVGIGEQVGIIIDWHLPRDLDSEVELGVVADGDLVGMIEVKAGEAAPPDPELPRAPSRR